MGCAAMATARPPWSQAGEAVGAVTSSSCAARRRKAGRAEGGLCPALLQRRGAAEGFRAPPQLPQVGVRGGALGRGLLCVSSSVVLRASARRRKVPCPPRHGLPAAPPVPLSDPELDALPPGPPLHFPHSQLLQVTVCFAGWAENQSGEGRDEACCQPRMSPVTARSGTAVASAEAQSVVLPEVALSCRDTTLPLLSSTCPRSLISQHRPGGATFPSFLSALSTASLLRSCGHKQSSRQSAVKAPRYSARGQSAPVLTASLSSPLLQRLVGFL